MVKCVLSRLPHLYRHVKRGTIYEVLFDDATRESDKAQLVVYRCIEDGKVWVRPASEFFDGRFEILDTCLNCYPHLCRK